MAQINYDTIRPLIASERFQGANAEFVFKCPMSGEQHQATSYMQHGPQSQVATIAKASMWGALRSAMASAVRSVLGGVAGSVASSAMYSTTSAMGSNQQSFSASDKQKAAVEAFKRVQQHFAWDANTNRFVSAKLFANLQTDFVRLMSSVAITEQWDRSVLARMLAEIAAADGQIGQEERGLFDAFGGTGAASIDELVRYPRLTAGELGQTSPQTQIREVLFMMAFALAYSDEELGAAEQTRLGEFAVGLGIPFPRAQELGKFAREHIVTLMLETIYADGVASQQERQQVAMLAARTGVDQYTLETLEAKLKKRKGIM